MIPQNNNQPHPDACQWCGATMPSGRRHGSARKFCSPSHRFAYHAALRRYALAQMDAGLLTMEMLIGDQGSVYALSADAKMPSTIDGTPR